MKYKKIQPLVAHGSAVRTVYFVALCCARIALQIYLLYILFLVSKWTVLQDTRAAMGDTKLIGLADDA